MQQTQTWEGECKGGDKSRTAPASVNPVPKIQSYIPTGLNQ